MGPCLLGFLRQMVGNQQAAEDVMQEIFIQMWRSPNGFAPERGTLRAYLFRVARKHAAEWWRNRERRTEAQSRNAPNARRRLRRWWETPFRGCPKSNEVYSG